MASVLPLVVIVGPTASGKTSAAIQLATQYDGEIICADSRTLYRGMDIGTAKPTFEERAGIPHWGLDLVLPNQRYTVGEFQLYAQRKIAEIRQRGKVPFLVGGTGLYVDSVVFDYQFPQPLDSSKRVLLELMDREELLKYCIKNNIELPEDNKNTRRVIRAINAESVTARKRHVPVADTIVVGITTKKSVLRERIDMRTEQMFENGVVDEAIVLGKKYSWNAEAMTSNVYRSIQPLLEDAATLDEVKQNFMIRDWQLAKRQMTWFRRNPYIEWCTLPDVEQYITHRLVSEYVL